MAVNMAELCCPMSNCFRIVLIDRLSGIGHKHPVLPRTDCSFSRYLLITCGLSGNSEPFAVEYTYIWTRQNKFRNIKIFKKIPEKTQEKHFLSST